MSARKTEKCNARKKNGNLCGLDAGWGTDHPGVGTCKFHGGSTPNAILDAAKQQAIVMGAPVDVHPNEALLQCVRLTAGEVAYCSQRIQELSHEEAVGHPIEITHTEGATGEDGYVNTTTRKEKVPMMNIWIRARAASMDRLAKYAKMALDAGVDERRVQIAENYAQVLVPVLETIFSELGLTDKQRKALPPILERNLLSVEGEAMTAATNGSGR